MIPLDAMPVPLANGKGFAWVDAIDVEAVGAWSWSRFQAKCHRTPYAHAGIAGLTPTLHRFVAERAGMPMQFHVDHIDRDGLNCTRSNLRPATPSQNHANLAPQRNNTSGYKGVNENIRNKGRWTARLQVRGQYRYLGSFDTPEAAARVYDAWALAGFGEFAALNFPEVG